MSDQREADRHVVLIGLPGAGRTSIGRQLARLLQRPFADADEQLALNAGCTIPQLVAAHGHDELRQQERQTLADLLERYAPLVIAAPGASEVHRDDRDLVARSAVVLWIRGSLPLPAELSAHYQDIADHVIEILTTGDSAIAPAAPDTRTVAEWEAAALPPLYEQVADHTVDTDPFHTRDDPIQAITDHIVALLALDAPPSR